MDDKIASAIATMGNMIVEGIRSTEWHPPILGALTDDGGIIKAVLLSVDGPEHQPAWLAAARRILQKYVDEGSCVVLAGIATTIEGLPNQPRAQGAIVMAVHRGGRDGVVFVMEKDGVNVFNTEDLNEPPRHGSSVGGTFDEIFTEINWPKVN